MRHKVRLTKGLTAIKHASALIANIGNNTATIFVHIIYETTVGARGATGGVQTIQDSSTTERDCQVGDVIKYANICLEAAPRGADPTNLNDNSGFIEWAIYWQRERSLDPDTTNTGVATIGVVCSHMFRENALMSGCFPIGARQAMATDIRVKIPQRCCKVHMGDQLKIAVIFRSSNSADMRTDSHRVMASSHFKAYS